MKTIISTHKEGSRMKNLIAHANFRGIYVCHHNGDMRFISDFDPARRMAVVRIDGSIMVSNSSIYKKCSGLIFWDEVNQKYRFLNINPEIETINDALMYIMEAKPKKSGIHILKSKTSNNKITYLDEN